MLKANSDLVNMNSKMELPLKFLSWFIRKLHFQKGNFFFFKYA